MKPRVELQGAEVRVVDCHEGQVAVYLGGAWPLGVTGMMFRAASWKGEPERCRGLIRDGWVFAAGRRHTVVSRSMAHCGPISAHLVFDSGEILRITAGAMDLLPGAISEAPAEPGGGPCCD